MINKTRLLAGLALGCVLSTPAAFAEEYAGFYFGIWGGTGEMDFGSQAAADEAALDMLPFELSIVPIQPITDLTAVPMTSSLDDSLSPWGAQVGYRFNKWVAAEFGYVNLGETVYTLSGAISGPYASCPCTDTTVTVRNLNGSFDRTTKVTSAGVTASVLGMFPIGPYFDLHLRGGAFYADTRVTNRLRYIDLVDQSDVFNLLHRRVDADETEWFAGVGGAWNINESFTLRVEYQKFFNVGNNEKAGETDIDVVNVSLLFR